MKNTENRNHAATVLRSYLKARRMKNDPDFYFYPHVTIESVNYTLEHSLKEFLALQDKLMTVTGGYYFSCGQKVAAHPVNPIDWFGKAWLVSIPIGNFGACYLVEADHVSDALDEFSESDKYGHLIRAEAEEVSPSSEPLTKEESESDQMFESNGRFYKYPEGTSFDGQGQPYDTSELHIEGRENKELPFACFYQSEGMPDLSPVEYYNRYNNRGLSKFIDASTFPF